MEKVIVLASSNKGKLREISQMLPDYKIVTAKELGFNDEIEEDGSTFYENALKKAKTVSTALNLPALADDSGLCIEALNGAPGIYSARYAGDGIDAHNIELVLKNMQGVENRKAKFVSCLVYYKPNGKIITATGESHGEIMKEKTGSNGFGYDPIYYSLDLKKCFGIASSEEKNSVSHRSRALRKFKELLESEENENI